MRIFATLLSVALLSIPGASLFSQDMMMDGTGFYAAAGGGATLITDTTETPQKVDLDADGTADTAKEADWDLDFGFSAGGAAGYDFGDFRTEAEFSFQSANFRHGEEIDNDDDKQGRRQPDRDGDHGQRLLRPRHRHPVRAVHRDRRRRRQPVGQAESRTKMQPNRLFEGSGWGFGYQANVGVAYEIVDAVALTLGYKFFGTLETQVTDPDDEEVYVKPNLMAHRAELGVRFRF